MKNRTDEFERAAGILLPISSLPSKNGIGTLGKAAYDFIDFLADAGQRYWQILPVGATSYGDSPYQSFSAFAGNPYYIDLNELKREGLLKKKEIKSVNWGTDAEKVDYALMFEKRFEILKLAYKRSQHSETDEYKKFCRKNADWLYDYSLYMSIKFDCGQRSWLEWDDDIRLRKASAVAEYKKKLSDEVYFWSFLQFKFFEQWKKLRSYAHKKGVMIIGDIPIYVAMDSADAWANGGQFMLDEDMRPVKVAGVPPDCFSEDGQLWGNPLYRWDVMEEDDFKWWKRRVSFSAQIYDVIRIDHFIGITRYYSIDAGSKTAKDGEWLAGPGMKLIEAIDEARGDTRIIAEDLGVISPEVRKTQLDAGYPGMKVFQFAFGDTTENAFLPHNYSENFVVYTGTHDNNTTLGYAQSIKKKELKFVKEYLNVEKRSEIPGAMIRAAYMSVAHTVIIPMQDFLELGSKARINTPSTLGGNWEWRMSADAASKELSEKIRKMTAAYGRKVKTE